MNKNIHSQKTYYNNRWSNTSYLNSLQVERLVAIIQQFQKIDVDKPYILDLGCGKGWLSGVLSNIGPTTAIDLSDEAIAKARNLYPSVNFIAGDLFNIPIEEEKYNIVISQEVIEHVSNQKAYINIAASYLKKGGFLILTTPNKFVQNRRTEEEHEKWGLQPAENWLNSKELSKLLSERFEVFYLSSIILGYGSKGIFKFINSLKIKKILEVLSLKWSYYRILCHLRLGLHLIVLAKKVK